MSVIWGSGKRVCDSASGNMDTAPAFAKAWTLAFIACSILNLDFSQILPNCAAVSFETICEHTPYPCGLESVAR
eukprot:2939405-Karenia_brevis.AAC.1